MNMHSKTTRLTLAGLALSGALAGALSVTAQAAPGGPDLQGTMLLAQGPGGPGGRGGPDGPGHPGGGLFDGMVTRWLDRVNATPEQRTKIQQIVQAQADERRAQREAGRALHDEMMALFAQPTVDAGAVEALRQKQLAQHDAASKRMTATMLEISRVLTPEQRKQIAEQMNQRREMMQRHQRERQSLEAPSKG